MKLFLSFIFSFCFLFQPDLEDLRTSYAKSNLSVDNAKAFIELAEGKTSSESVILAYKAAAKIMEAKITSENNKRKSLIRTGVTNLEHIIKANPNNAELRVIRLSIQENLPKIVGYHKNMKEDQIFLMKNYNKQNNELKSYIKNFASQSKSMTALEKASFK